MLDRSGLCRFNTKHSSHTTSHIKNAQPAPVNFYLGYLCYHLLWLKPLEITVLHVYRRAHQKNIALADGSLHWFCILQLLHCLVSQCEISIAWNCKNVHLRLKTGWHSSRKPPTTRLELLKQINFFSPCSKSLWKPFVQCK